MFLIHILASIGQQVIIINSSKGFKFSYILSWSVIKVGHGQRKLDSIGLFKTKFQESILPNLAFLRFLIFIYKLNYLLKTELTLKQPSLIARNGKILRQQKKLKSLARLPSGIHLFESFCKNRLLIPRRSAN